MKEAKKESKVNTSKKRTAKRALSKTNTVDLVKRRPSHTRADGMTGANERCFWAVELKCTLNNVPV